MTAFNKSTNNAVSLQSSRRCSLMRSMSGAA